MSKFTPGPWKVFGYPAGDFSIDGLNADGIATVNSSDGCDEPEIYPAAANANLIAAAPEMYEALKAPLCCPNRQYIAPFAAKAMAALAKADGGQQ